MSRPNVPEFYLVYQDYDLTLQVAENVPLELAQEMLLKLREFMNVSAIITEDFLYRVEQQMIGFLLELINRGELREWSTSKVPGYTTAWIYRSNYSRKGRNWGPECS